jgi:hypothetical protein
MITLKEWLEIVDYRITEGSDYYNSEYGDSVYSLDSWNGEQTGHSFSIIFDTKTQSVFEVQAHDFKHNRAYRMIADGFTKNDDKAWDDVNYVDLDVDDDFIQKALAIKAGEDYDTRVSIELDLDTDLEIELYRIAHKRDITVNQLVVEIIEHMLKRESND